MRRVKVLVPHDIRPVRMLTANEVAWLTREGEHLARRAWEDGVRPESDVIAALKDAAAYDTDWECPQIDWEETVRNLKEAGWSLRVDKP